VRAWLWWFGRDRILIPFYAGLSPPVLPRWAHNADIAMLIRMRVRFMSALIPSATAMLAGKTSRCCDVGHIEVCLGTA